MRATTNHKYGIVTYQVNEDVHFKVETWRKALEKKHDRPVARWEVVEWMVDMIGPPPDSGKFAVHEIVIFDPENPDTYPSVCVEPNEVKDRFGFVGGEKLIFTAQGAYVGQVVAEVGRLEDHD